MSARSLVLHLGGVRIGVVAGQRGRLRFRYDEDVATPLSTSMPIAEREHGHARIHPWLWGLLPESEPVRQRWGSRFEVPADDVVGLLGTEIGLDCPGAVQCVPEDGVLPSTSELQEVSESDLARALRSLREDGTTWLGPDDDGRFSLAGAQAKTALVYGTDAHAKNYSLLLAGDQVRLRAPDAFSSAASDPIVAELDHDLPGRLTDAVAARSGMVLRTLDGANDGDIQ